MMGTTSHPSRCALRPTSAAYATWCHRDAKSGQDPFGFSLGVKSFKPAFDTLFNNRLSPVGMKMYSTLSLLTDLAETNPPSFAKTIASCPRFAQRLAI